METIVPFLSAAGVGGIIGGVITSVLQSWLSRRAVFDERKFREKKEAYVNILQAIHQSKIEGTAEAAKYVGHWRNVCDLVASPAVRRHIDQLFVTNPLSDGGAHPKRPQVLANLRTAMRADLSITAPERD